MKSKANFKVVIEELAKKQKKTLYNVAKYSEISMSNLYRWDKNIPNVIELYNVSKYLNVPMEQIIKKAI